MILEGILIGWVSARSVYSVPLLAGTILFSLNYWFLPSFRLQPASSELLSGSLASRSLHSSGRNRKQWCSQCQGWGWGQHALKVWEKPATPLQVGQSLEKQWDLENWVYCVKRTQNHALDRGKSRHRTSEDRGTMANKRVYRDQGWLCSKRLEIQRIEEMISIALNLICLTLPASSRESLRAQRRKHIIFILGKSSELKRRLQKLRRLFSLYIQEDPSWKVSGNC